MGVATTIKRSSGVSGILIVTHDDIYRRDGSVYITGF